MRCTVGPESVAGNWGRLVSRFTGIAGGAWPYRIRWRISTFKVMMEAMFSCSRVRIVIECSLLS